MNINEIIKERRSIYPKEFNGQIIDDSIIENLLENAQWAPSHGAIYPWRFKVFTRETMFTLTDKMAELYEKYTPADKFRSEKPERLRMNAEQCSHIIAICFSPSGKYPETEELCAVACSVQNIWLSLSQYEDVGGYWSTGGGTFTKEMDIFLNLEDTERCIGFFLLGKINSKRTKGHRPLIENNTEWIK